MVTDLYIFSIIVIYFLYRKCVFIYNVIYNFSLYIILSTLRFFQKNFKEKKAICGTTHTSVFISSIITLFKHDTVIMLVAYICYSIIISLALAYQKCKHFRIDTLDIVQYIALCATAQSILTDYTSSILICFFIILCYTFFQHSK